MITVLNSNHFEKTRIFISDHKYLFLFFGFALLVRLYLITQVGSVLLQFGDGTEYDATAWNIIHGNLYNDFPFHVLPGYPMILSIAYSLSNFKMTVYFYELVINSFISASIIFPTYLICKKFTPVNVALAISLLVGISPTAVLYSPTLLCENLFIPLFMITLWLLLEFFNDNNKFAGFFLGLGIFYLYLTRPQGIIVIIAFIVITILFFFKNNSKNKVSLISKILPPYVSLIGFFSLWTIYKFSHPEIFTSSSQYSTDPYMSIFFIILHNFDNFFLFVQLLFTEFSYLIGSVIVLPVAGLIFLSLFIITAHYDSQSDRKNDSLSKKENRYILSLSYVIPFFLICSFGMVVISVLHMFGPVSNGDSAYLIFGRYIDPIIPPILTFGAIGIYFISTCLEKRSTITRDFILFVLGLTIFTLAFLPQKWGWIYNSLSSWYFGMLQSIFSPLMAQLFFVFFTLIAVIIFLIFAMKGKNILPLFVYLGIIFLFLTWLTFPQMMVGGQHIDKVSEYFQNRSITNLKIGADQNEIKNRYWIISFWSSNEIIHDVFSFEQIDDNQKFYSSKYNYIISHKKLPLTPIVIDDTYQVTLYSTSLNTSHPFILTPFFYKSDFFGPEYWSSSDYPIRWMTTHADLEIYSYGDQIAELSFSAISFNGTRNLNVYLEENRVSQLEIPSSDFITTSIPLSFKNGANNIQLRTESCDTPSSIPEMHNSDPRCLSIAVQNISVN